MRKLREYWLSWWVGMFLSRKWNALWKTAFHKKTFQQSTNCVSSFLPREPRDFIHLFWCLYALVPRLQIPRWKAGRLKPLIILKNESIRVTKNVLMSALWAIHGNRIVYSILNWSIRSRMAVGWIFIRIFVNGFRDGFCANFSRIMNDGPS